MSTWPYPYCPHQAYNSNLKLRLSSIPYTIFPDPTIDAFTNLNVKSANLNKSNIPTIAYENYFIFNKAEDLNRNFAKDFYMQTLTKQDTKLDNKIVDELKADMMNRNAYALAEGATIDYNNFEAKRTNAINSARRRAASAYRSYSNQLKQDRAHSMQDNAAWLTKLYRKLEEVAQHIVNGDQENPADRERLFLQSKVNLTAKYLKLIKVRNPKAACDILEELKILMQKKKLKFEDQREEQEKNKSVSMSYTSQASQNTSQGSMLSEATSVNQSNINGEEEIIKKFCDFTALKQKWNASDLDTVKYLLRLTFTKKFVSDAELTAVKKKRQADKINSKIIKNNSNPKNKDQKNKSTTKNMKKKKSPQKNTHIQPLSNLNRNIAVMTKQELNIKQKLLKGGQFDAVGQKFSRNRNYSQIFTERSTKLMKNFEFKKQEENLLKQKIINIQNKAAESKKNLKKSNLESTLNLNISQK